MFPRVECLINLRYILHSIIFAFTSDQESLIYRESSTYILIVLPCMKVSHVIQSVGNINHQIVIINHNVSICSLQYLYKINKKPLTALFLETKSIILHQACNNFPNRAFGKVLIM